MILALFGLYMIIYCIVMTFKTCGLGWYSILTTMLIIGSIVIMALND